MEQNIKLKENNQMEHITKYQRMALRIIKN
jgi:hypothetical protein